MVSLKTFATKEVLTALEMMNMPSGIETLSIDIRLPESPPDGRVKDYELVKKRLMRRYTKLRTVVLRGRVTTSCFEYYLRWSSTAT